MDQPDSAKAKDEPAPIAVDDMRPVPPREPAAENVRTRRHRPERTTHPSRLPGLLAFGAMLFGITAFAFSGWIYSQGQQEIMRLSTELAQLRVSLDLYARNGGGGETLAALQDRLTTLENAMAADTVPMPAATATATTPSSEAGAQQEDCLPLGMRLLVAAGDTYPVCRQSAAVEVSFVDNGYITLADGTSVPSGGSMPLPGSQCMIAVTSGGDEGLTGYAEIRVSC